MVNFCAVYSCSAKAGKNNLGQSFFRFPKVNDKLIDPKVKNLQAERRKAWIKSVNRLDFSDSKCNNYRICSRHFVTGKPAELFDRLNPDWVPCRNMGHGKDATEQNSSRHIRASKRSVLGPIQISKEGERAVQEPDVEETMDTVEEIRYVDNSTQTDICGSEIDNLLKSNKDLKDEIICKHKMSREKFERDPEQMIFYTGLPTFAALMILHDDICKYLPSSSRCVLNTFQQLVLVLMKLRLSLTFKDLGYRFGVSIATVSRTFHTVLPVLDSRLNRLIFWPSREELKKTMPRSFREAFGDAVTIVIDCFEIFIEKPSNVMAKCQTWSTYKHHNTVKYLIGITPQGVVSFISNGFGGRCSDKHVTQVSGILDKIQPGDVILADRGFNISEDVGLRQAAVNIPAFTRGKNQLDPLEVEDTRKIASVRIHVERVIGEIRSRFTLLSDILPIIMLKDAEVDDCMVDQIVRVSCALCNIWPSVVPL